MVPRVSCSVDIGVSITIILDWVHSMCIISHLVARIYARDLCSRPFLAKYTDGCLGIRNDGSAK